MHSPKSSNFGRKTLSEQVADSIESRIRSGDWSGLAPSSREVAIMNHVSLPTAQEALAHLVLRKVLRERGPKRRLEVVLPNGMPEVAASRVAVLVVSPCALSLLDTSTMLALRQMEASLQSQGHRFRLVDLGHLSGEALRKAGYAAVVDFQATHCLMTLADPALYSGLARHPISLATMQGKLNASRLQRLAIPFQARLNFALDRLAALGHRHVLMLRRRGGDFPDMGDEPSAQSGVPYKVSLHLSAYEKLSDFPTALQRGLSRGATAVLFVNLEDVVHGLIYCANHRLKVPGNLSIVNLAGELDTPKGSLTVAGVALSFEARAASVMHWVHAEPSADEVNFIWKEGETLGPAPGPASNQRKVT